MTNKGSVQDKLLDVPPTSFTIYAQCTPAIWSPLLTRVRNPVWDAAESVWRPTERAVGRNLWSWAREFES